jgi:hypothetical protein
MSEWIDHEAGPKCCCGGPTFVHLHEGKASLICMFHTREEGAFFLLPKAKPAKWPGLTNVEMEQLVKEGMKEHDVENDVSGPPQGTSP